MPCRPPVDLSLVIAQRGPFGVQVGHDPLRVANPGASPTCHALLLCSMCTSPCRGGVGRGVYRHTLGVVRFPAMLSAGRPRKLLAIWKVLARLRSMTDSDAQALLGTA